MKTSLRWIFRIVFGIVLLVVIVLSSVTFLKIPINLTRFKEPVEALASKALQRQVIIENSIIISTSLNPEFSLGGLRIGNPEGFSQDTFMFLESARIQVRLLPLLKKKLHITGVNVQKLHVNLEENTNGQVNWVFSADDSPEKKPEVKAKAASGEIQRQQFEITGDTIVIQELNLDQIALNYYSPGIPEPSTYQIEKCVGSMLPGKPMDLDITGKLLAIPYTLEIGIASLQEALTNKSSWMEIRADISETKLLFSGNINLAEANESLALKTAVSGESLDSLNNLLRIDLPPLGPYSVEADLFMENQSFVLKNLSIKTGSSSLNGTAKIIAGEQKAEVAVEFTSPLFQLDDFTFEDWSWVSDDPQVVSPDEATGGDTSAKETSENVDEPSDKTERKLLGPAILGKLDATLSFRSERILSGDDELGSGLLKASVRDGRIAIEPLELKVPGGAITLAASIQPGIEQADASLKATMKNFDIGILVRRNKPEAKMGGLVNLDMDVKSSAATFDQMLANGNGYLDFSGQLNNLNAGIIDLWAVNLIAAIVSKTDEDQSQINCAVGRWSVKDGLLTPDVFFIDTSKIRICGTGQVDFKKERIDLKISPSPKRAEFFNLATPLEVKGTFDEIGLGLENFALIGTSVKFITSPVVVPFKRVFSEEIPEDGSDACVVVLGPSNRSESNVDGCK